MDGGVHRYTCQNYAVTFIDQSIRQRQFKTNTRATRLVNVCGLKCGPAVLLVVGRQCWWGDRMLGSNSKELPLLSLLDQTIICIISRVAAHIVKAGYVV